MTSRSDVLWAGIVAGFGIGYCFCVAGMPISAGVVAGALAALVAWLVGGFDRWLGTPKRLRSPGLLQRRAVYVRALTGGQRCAYCHDDVEGSDGAQGACVACGATYHVGCLLEFGGCATLGCAYAPRIARQAVRQ